MIDLNKVLVIGGGGKIASILPFGIKKSHQELNALDKEQIRNVCNLLSPTAILCLSSLDLRKSEENPIHAFNVNALAAYNASLEAKKRNIPIIIVTSGAMFNGSIEKRFSEDDSPDSLNIYGQSKYFAELLISEATENYLIIRTGWIFGGKEKEMSFIDKMINLAREGKELTATFDQVGSPTYIPDFISALKSLIEQNAKGIYHIVNEGAASAVNIMEEAIDILKSKSNLKKVSVNDFSSNIKRSQSEALVSNKIKLRHWKDALKEFLAGK